MTGPDPTALDRLRATSGLSIDDEGRFLHRGEPITHARTLEVLWRSLRPLPGGGWEVAIGRERATVAVADAPYAVRGVTADPAGAPLLHLSDRSVETLDPATVRLAPDGVLRCTVKDGRPARFTRAGQVGVEPWLREDPPGSGRFTLLVNGARWPIHGP